MNQMTQEHRGFSELTKTSLDRVLGLNTGTTTRPGVVHYFSFEAAEFPQPDGCVSIADHISAREKNPAKRAALEAARQELAGVLYGDKATIAALRMKKGWSQQRLADEMGTSQPQVARIESGRLDPQLSTLRKLSAALGCGMQEIIQALENG